MAAHFHALLGKGFAADGNHGGVNIGFLLTMEWEGWLLGGQGNFIAERSRFMSSNPIQPRERYSLLGVLAGRRHQEDEMAVSWGLGAGWLEGKPRTGLLREYEDCDSWILFGPCPEEDVVLVKEYQTNPFSTLSINPFFSLDYQAFRSVAFGVMGQAFINPKQGLATLALYMKFGS